MAAATVAALHATAFGVRVPAELLVLEQEPKVQTGKPSAYYRASAFCLHNLAYFAGSSWTFGLVLLLIGGWAVAGIFLHGNEIWQIVMQASLARDFSSVFGVTASQELTVASLQDASSIQCYLWDITLLFIQRYDFERLSQHLSVLQVGLPPLTTPPCRTRVALVVPDASHSSLKDTHTLSSFCMALP